MKIEYITNARIPTEKAHGYQIAKMCEAFADLGATVTLTVPRRTNPITESAYRYYGIKHNFEIRHLPVIDWLTSPLLSSGLGFFLLSAHFLIRCIFLNIPRGSLVYTRSPEIAWLFSFLGHQTFFECHQLPEGKGLLFRYFLKKCRGITTSSIGMKLDLHKNIPGFDSEKILVAPNGFDPEVFSSQITDRAKARNILDLSEDEKITLYTGHLYAWKGVDTLAKAAQITPQISFFFVGGTDKDRVAFAEKYPFPNIKLIPFQPREKVALWLKAADVLALPNSPTNALSERHTSPIKMFEYMASGTPIVASNLPSLKEILSAESCLLFKPDDYRDLAEQVSKLLDNKALGSELASRAMIEVNKYTWKNRAKAILDHLNQND